MNLPNALGFIQGPPGSGKSTLIRVIIKVLRDIDEVTNKSRQILVCCPSNDATNSVCRNTHKAYEKEDLIRLHPYNVEKSYMQWVARRYGMEQTFESVSTLNPHLVESTTDTKAKRHLSLIAIGAAHRTLQRVGLIDKDGNFLDIDDADTRYTGTERAFQVLFRRYHDLSHEEELDLDRFFKLLFKDTLKVRFRFVSLRCVVLTCTGRPRCIYNLF